METPPFEVGDIVHLIPKRGCSIDAYFCNTPLEVERIERAAVEPEVVWDIDLKGCPYLIIYCKEDVDDYDIVATKQVRDIPI